jgi:hypothetical protein
MVRLVIGAGLTALGFALVVLNAVHGSLVGVALAVGVIVAGAMYSESWADDGR